MQVSRYNTTKSLHLVVVWYGRGSRNGERSCQPEPYLQLDVGQDVVGQLHVALSQGHDGLQLPTHGGPLQVVQRRVLVPGLVLLTEAARLVVVNQGQVDLDDSGVKKKRL